MLTAKEFWNLIEHIIPVYVIVFFGWALYRFKFILPVHAPGINRFTSLMAIPAYAFWLLAFNDPYQIDLRLVAADVLQKFVALAIGICYWSFAKNGKIDHVINFFMLATLPNTVLIGDSLLDPLYGASIHGKVVTIIFLQVCIWYNLTIALYELRIVLNEIREKADAEDLEANFQGQLKREKQTNVLSSPKSPHSVIIMDNGVVIHSGSHDSCNELDAGGTPVLERTLSAPARVSFSKVAPMVAPRSSISKVDESTSMRDFPSTQDTHASHDTRPYDPFSLISGEKLSNTETIDGTEQGVKQLQEFRSDKLGVKLSSAQPKRSESQRVSTVKFCSVVAYKVFHRLKYVPLTFASLLGFVYSLFAYKWHWQMPYYVETSVSLISSGAIGLAIFILGMSWAISGKLIACGWRKMTLGMVIRFIVSPFIMIVTAQAVRLRGDTFRFAVLQAVIPQGVISFVLAKEYNLSVDEFSTAVVFQLLVFIPVIVIYYLALGAV